MNTTPLRRATGPIGQNDDVEPAEHVVGRESLAVERRAQHERIEVRAVARQERERVALG